MATNLTPEEARFVEEVRSRSGPNHESTRLIAIIDRLKLTIFNVGDRVAAYNYRGEKLGNGRVTSSQRTNGLYMKVRIDGGVEVIVPQAMCKKLVRK